MRRARRYTGEMGAKVSMYEILTFFMFLSQMIRICVHNVRVLHQNEGGIGKSVPDAQEKS